MSSVASRCSGVSSPARPPRQIPSNGSAGDEPRALGAEVRLEAALDDPEQRLVGPRVGRERALRPAMGPLRRLGDDRARRRRRHRLVERDRDVRAERLLDARSRAPA